MDKRVMVVDDSTVTRTEIESILQGTDYVVAAHCRSGEEALERYEQVAPDVVTMDIVMPGMDGLEAASALLRSHSGARVVMLSSLAYDDTASHADKVGARAFVPKPLERERFLAALDQATAGV